MDCLNRLLARVLLHHQLCGKWLISFPICALWNYPPVVMVNLGCRFFSASNRIASSGWSGSIGGVSARKQALLIGPVVPPAKSTDNSKTFSVHNVALDWIISEDIKMLGYQIKHDALVHLILDHHSLSHFYRARIVSYHQKMLMYPRHRTKTINSW